MRFDSGDRKPIHYDGSATADPTGATVALRVDGTTHPMTLGTVTQDGDAWTFTAATDDLFAGPDVDPGTAVTLTSGRHMATVVLTIGDVVLESRDEALDVG